MGDAHEGHGHADVDVHVEREVSVLLGPDAIHGSLVIPRTAAGVVALAHASSGGRGDGWSQALARSFQRRGLATLAMDLLTADESAHDDVELIAARMTAVEEWLATHDDTSRLGVGWLATDVAAAAALRAAAARPRDVYAIVSVGGRPDLAGDDVLPDVHAPTLVILGSEDRGLKDLARSVLDRLEAEGRLATVRTESARIVEDERAMGEVARLAGEWFVRHLVGPERTEPEGPVRARGRARSAW